MDFKLLNHCISDGIWVVDHPTHSSGIDTVACVAGMSVNTNLIAGSRFELTADLLSNTDTDERGNTIDTHCA